MWPKLFFFPRNLTYYYAEPITGLFSSMPVIWILLFACIVVPLRVIKNWQREEPNLIKSFQEQPLSVWLGWMVVGAFISNLSLLSIFIFSTMRYEADLAPLLVILVLFCMGWASNTFRSRPRLWKPILIAVGILTLISIAIGLLTNFQIVDWPFKNNNPRLYQAIEHFFTK
jgi:hypothetical protein